MEIRNGLACVVAGVLVALCGNGMVSAAVVTLDFNSDGVKPHTELLSIDAGSTVVRNNDGRQSTDFVEGGLWKVNPNDNPLTDRGTNWYGGNVPTLASSAANTPLSINVRLRLLKNIPADDQFYFRLGGPQGTVFLYFNYNNELGTNEIGGRNSGGKQMRAAGVSLGDWHNLALTWDPTQAGSSPGRLYVDGELLSLASTFVFTTATSTAGYVEFGDALNIANGFNPVAEVDWLRFGTDLVVVQPVPEPAGLFAVLAGCLLGFRRRRA